MDARGQALTNHAARPRSTSACALALAIVAGVGMVTPVAADPSFTSLELQEQLDAGVLDAETLAELDDLLRDPVDLNRGDLERLRRLPWLDAAAIDALHSARPLADWDALSRLPGWDEERVRLTRAFAQLVPPAGAVWRAELTRRMLRARDEWFLNTSTPDASMQLRRTTDPLLHPTGYATARLGVFRLLAGDLKASQAQGLLWASSREVLRAGAASLRSGRGFTGTTSLDRTRVVRGAAVEAHAGPLLFEFASGTNDSMRLDAGAVQVASGGARVRAAALKRADGVWLAMELRRDVGQGGAALEVAHGDGHIAWALAARVRERDLQLAARLENAPARVSPFAAAAPRNGGALADVRWRHAGVSLRASAAVNAGSDSLGAHMREQDRALEARWNVHSLGLEARWGERRTRTGRVGVEAEEPDADRVLRRFMARVRWERRGSRGWFEHRSVELTRTDEPAESGNSWQVGIEARRRPWRATVVCTAFRVTHGDASPTVPEPSIGAGASAWHLYGDGLRAALGLRFDRAYVSCLVRAAWQVTAPGSRDALAEAAFQLRKS